MKWLSYRMHSDQRLHQEKRMVKVYKNTKDYSRRQKRYWNIIWEGALIYEKYV